MKKNPRNNFKLLEWERPHSDDLTHLKKKAIHNKSYSKQSQKKEDKLGRKYLQLLI